MRKLGNISDEKQNLILSLPKIMFDGLDKKVFKDLEFSGPKRAGRVTYLDRYSVEFSNRSTPIKVLVYFLKSPKDPLYSLYRYTIFMPTSKIDKKVEITLEDPKTFAMRLRGILPEEVLVVPKKKSKKVKNDSK